MSRWDRNSRWRAWWRVAGEEPGCHCSLTALLTAAAGAVLGALNGALVAGLGVPSIVATLAAMAFWRELLRWITQGAWVQGLPRRFQWMGLSQATGEMAIIWRCAALLLRGLCVVPCATCRRGARCMPSGSQRESARLAGIPVRAISFGVFMLMGALTGMAALLDSRAVFRSAEQRGRGAGTESDLRRGDRRHVHHRAARGISGARCWARVCWR